MARATVDHQTERTTNDAVAERESLSPTAAAVWLRGVGQRVTAQRLSILGAFVPGEHLTADDVFARLEPLAPAVNRSTVYRTLELFRDLGLLSETDLGGGARQFELLHPGRHHHLICHGCGQMLVLADDLVNPLREAVRDRYGFEPRIDHLALFGWCQDCRERGREHGTETGA